MNLSALIHDYRADTASPYGKLRIGTRQRYDSLLRRIERDLGEREVSSIKGRDLTITYEDWAKSGVPMAHGLMQMLRTIAGYGATLLDDEACATLATKMRFLRFKMGQPRQVRITAAQVVAIRQQAHLMGLHSIARAQALQFEGTFRQRDVIGEWVPVSEPGESYVEWEGRKWLRGLRWDEIDADRVLRHITSKKQKEVEIDLKLADMVMQEFGAVEWPKRGPVITAEATGKPWTAVEFRRMWRVVAREAGIPDEIRNMDSRAGAISEATDAGASLEMVRHAATHSDVATTARYSRNAPDKIKEVQRLRLAHREGA
jgi:hypothetical protein